MASSPEVLAATGPVIVRKYGNRRLYRTDESRYVTLDELALMVRSGVDFEVHDAKTQRDLTGVVLAQVILEEEKRAEGGTFPVSVLRQLIKLRDGSLDDFLVHHLPRLTEIYLEAHAAVGASLDDVTVGARTHGSGDGNGGGYHHPESDAAILGRLVAVQGQLQTILDELGDSTLHA